MLAEKTVALDGYGTRGPEMVPKQGHLTAVNGAWHGYSAAEQVHSGEHIETTHGVMHPYASSLLEGVARIYLVDASGRFWRSSGPGFLDLDPHREDQTLDRVCTYTLYAVSPLAVSLGRNYHDISDCVPPRIPAL
jgi:hypothetical protein